MAETIAIAAITKRIQVRSVKPSGVDRLGRKMEKLGFLSHHPLLVASDGNGGYELIDGNHRYEAAKALGLTNLPIHIIADPLSDNDKKKMARQANEAAETIVPTTFVDDAEFVWEEHDLGKTHKEIQTMLGWGSVDKVDNYNALRKITPKAWKIIPTTLEEIVGMDKDDAVGSKPTNVGFTEGLLRSILDLEPAQQLELVQALATEQINKGKFKSLAEAYRARNEMEAYALALLGDLGEAYTTQLIETIHSGHYDNDWKNDEHPKLHKLIQSIRDEWERKNSIHLVNGDFYEEVKKVGTGSIDLIITDPPYNISRDNEFELEGRSNISQDYGEWDKFEEDQFIAFFDIWAIEWARILRDQGSGYVFTSDSYISHLRSALENAGLHVKATIIWHKTNPGTQQVKTNFKSSVEYILFFTKGQGGHTFNWQGENEMHNFIETPVCGGKERLVDAKKDTLHPTQKPEQLIRHFMDISSNRGDVIFDGFAGVSTTGAVAKKLGRKFIGIEQEKKYFDAALERLSDD